MKARPLSYVLAFFWAFSAAALLIGLLELVGQLRPASRTDIVTLGALEALVFVLATFGVLRVHAPDRAMADALALRPADPILLATALSLGLVLQGASTSVAALVERFSPTPSEVLALRTLLLRTDTLPQTLLLTLVLCCLVPLLEELFYRGALFTSLSREHTAAGAAWATALCFALGRPDVRTWPALLLVAAALSHLRLHAGSVLPCIALHVGYSGADVAAALSGVSASGLPWPFVLACWIASAGLVVLVQYLGAHGALSRRAREQDDT
jgi:hypothetical protein